MTRIFCPHCGEKLPDETTGLTKRQSQALRFIVDFIVDHEFSPSYDEILDALNLGSKSGVHRIITELEQRGAVTRRYGHARSIYPTESGLEALEGPELHQRPVHGGERTA